MRGLGKSAQTRGVSAAANDRSRAAFLTEICDLLWPPAPTGVAALATAGSSSNLMVLPNLRHPRLVVAPDRRVAAAAVRRYGEPRSASSRWGQRGLSLLMRSGVGGAVLRKRVRVRPPSGTSTIESYLSEELQQELRISMYLGAARANRKPVLQLIAPDGDTGRLRQARRRPRSTQQLVRAETATPCTALGRERLPGAPCARGPAATALARACRCWCSRRATGGLPPGHAARRRRLAEAMHAGRGPRLTPATPGPLALRATARAGWPTGPDARPDGVPGVAAARRCSGSRHGRRHDSSLRRLARRLDALEHGDPRRRGCWSGTGSGSQPGVPLGFDALHHALQTAASTATRATRRRRHGRPDTARPSCWRPFDLDGRTPRG